MNVFKVITMVPIVIILLVVIFHTVWSVFDLDTFPSYVLSVCVSALCIIGMSRSMRGSLGIIMMSYTALGITMILMVLVSFFYRCLNKRREQSCDQLDKKERGICDES